MEFQAIGIETFGHFEVLQWYEYVIYCSVSVVLIFFAGAMSGLTLGLLSLDKLTLQILKTAGNAREKKYATRLLPLLNYHHVLLVTLLLVCFFFLKSFM